MKTVLVVDDELKILQLARDYLEHAGFTVLTASDGKTALAAARSAKPNLMVLDLGLPDLDGLDVTRAESGLGVLPERSRTRSNGTAALRMKRQASAGGERRENE